MSRSFTRGEAYLKIVVYLNFKILSIFPLSMVLIFDFGTVPTVWYFFSSFFYEYVSLKIVLNSHIILSSI
jgi:hypothetical protein